MLVKIGSLVVITGEVIFVHFNHSDLYFFDDFLMVFMGFRFLFFYEKCCNIKSFGSMYCVFRRNGMLGRE